MRPSTPERFHDALAAALNFPSHYGRNWDAAHDSFRGLELHHPFALVWRNADRIASSDPKLFGEACAVLAEEFRALGSRGIQAELVVTGDGPAFSVPNATGE
jgi:RNAse (barnase) inhibitor barstar